MQYGGGRFNGVLISGLGLLPAARYDLPSPLAQGYVTVGTDSGHQNKPGEPPQTFALNDRGARQLRPRVVQEGARRLGRADAARLRQTARQLYFVGSSEGGREGLTMAQRYPKDFERHLQPRPGDQLDRAAVRRHAQRPGERWATRGSGRRWSSWSATRCSPPATQPTDGRRHRVRPGRLPPALRRHQAALLGAPSGRLPDRRPIRPLQTLRSPLRFDCPLANGVREYRATASRAGDAGPWARPAAGARGGRAARRR